MSQLADGHLVDRYPTVDEVIAATKALGRRSPLCSARQVGVSRTGQPLWLLTIGAGGCNVVVVAMAHPDEPVGAVSALRLADQLTRELAQSDQTEQDVSWHFLFCLNPDGARRNESWFTAPPMTLDKHFRGMLRPVAAEQPEWLSPTGTASQPETHAVLDVIDDLQPFLHCSLHGVDVGGSYLQLTRPIPELAEAFGALASGLAIPLEIAAVDASRWPSPHPGVYLMPDPRVPDTFEALPEYAVVRSTWYRPHRYGGTTAIIEAPMWAADQVADATSDPRPSDTIAAAAQTLRFRGHQVADVARQISPDLRDGPALRAARECLRWSAALPDEWERITPLDTSSMSVGRGTSLAISARRLPLRAAGMLLQSIDANSYHQATLERLISQWCTELTATFRPRWIPLQRQTALQTSTLLAAARHARRP